MIGVLGKYEFLEKVGVSIYINDPECFMKDIEEYYNIEKGIIDEILSTILEFVEKNKKYVIVTNVAREYLVITKLNEEEEEKVVRALKKKIKEVWEENYSLMEEWEQYSRALKYAGMPWSISEIYGCYYLRNTMAMHIWIFTW